MKMPITVGIFIYISRENFMLSWVEHEIFYNLRAKFRNFNDIMQVRNFLA